MRSRHGALAWSEGVYDLFDLCPRSRATREQAVALYHPDSREAMEAMRARAIRECGRFSLDARIRTAKGRDRWMRLTADVASENGIAVRLFGMKRDITEERALLERLRTDAETDVLTGMANRGVFQARLAAAAKGEAARPGALLLVDLDGFKRINDTFGHLAGDECLRQAADRLRRLCAGDSLVARLGGDEFAIVMAPGTTAEGAAERAAAIVATMRSPIAANGQQLRVGASVCVAFPRQASVFDASRLLEDADLALYAAKTSGRDTARIFTPDLANAARLTRAVDQQFDLFEDRVGSSSTGLSQEG